MKYFTPDLYVRLQARDPDAMDRADAAWADAGERYDGYLQTILPELPPSVRQLLEGYYLHDAKVLNAVCEGVSFVIRLRLDVPPNDQLSLTYTLIGEPRIDRSALPPDHCSICMTWQYDEFEICGTDNTMYYQHSILFSNGWEIQVPFREVRLATVRTIYPCGENAPLSPISKAPQVS